MDPFKNPPDQRTKPLNNPLFMEWGISLTPTLSKIVYLVIIADFLKVTLFCK